MYDLYIRRLYTLLRKLNGYWTLCSMSSIEILAYNDFRFGVQRFNLRERSPAATVIDTDSVYCTGEKKLYIHALYWQSGRYIPVSIATSPRIIQIQPLCRYAHLMLSRKL